MIERRTVKTLDRGYSIIEQDTRNVNLGGVSGWISYFIVDKNGDNIESFSSVQRAVRWWELNGGSLDEVFNESLEKEAKKLTKRMGIKWDTLSLEEKQEWIDELSD